MGEKVPEIDADSHSSSSSSSFLMDSTTTTSTSTTNEAMKPLTGPRRKIESKRQRKKSATDKATVGDKGTVQFRPDVVPSGRNDAEQAAEAEVKKKMSFKTKCIWIFFVLAVFVFSAIVVVVVLAVKNRYI